MATATRTRRTAKPKVVEVVPDIVEEEELEDEVEETEEPEEELEEEEEEEVEVAKPSRKESAQNRAKAGVTYGVQHLADSILAITGETVTTRELRQLIRKMARDESGRVDREIVAGNRARYDWAKGEKDPEVKAIIAAYKGGELAADKKEKLDALKATKAAQVAAKKAAAEAAEKAPAKPAAKKAAAPVAKTAAPAKRRAKPAPVEVVEDDEELDLDEE